MESSWSGAQGTNIGMTFTGTAPGACGRSVARPGNALQTGDSAAAASPSRLFDLQVSDRRLWFFFASYYLT